MSARERIDFLLDEDSFEEFDKLVVHRSHDFGLEEQIYPGDGVAPLKATLRDLRLAGFKGVLSLELFNPDYWKQDPLVVAKTGLAKMRAAVQSSLE